MRITNEILKKLMHLISRNNSLFCLRRSNNSVNKVVRAIFIFLNVLHIFKILRNLLLFGNLVDLDKNNNADKID